MDAALLRFCRSACFAVAAVSASPAHAGRSAEVPVTGKQMQMLGIEVHALERQAPAGYARFPAQAIAAPGSERVIGSPLAGVVLELLVQQNQAVAAGTPLVRLAGEELGEKQMRLLQAAARFDLARSAMERDTRLLEEGIVPARRAQEAKAAYAESRAALEQARAALRLLGMPRAAIARVIASGEPAASVTLAAPRAGVLTRVAVKPGQRVEPSAVLMQLSQLERLWLEIQVPAQRAGEWARGTPVRVAGRSLAARIVNQSPVVLPDSQTVLLRAEVEGRSPPLRPGETVVAELRAGEAGEAFELPLAALAYDGAQAYVFVRTARGFEARPVAVRASGARSAQVQGRLQAGEAVAVRGVVALKGAWLEGK